jgi:hypothetical protein
MRIFFSLTTSYAHCTRNFLGMCIIFFRKTSCAHNLSPTPTSGTAVRGREAKPSRSAPASRRRGGSGAAAAAMKPSPHFPEIGKKPKGTPGLLPTKNPLRGDCARGVTLFL